MWYVVLTFKDDIFKSDCMRSFMQFQHHNITSDKWRIKIMRDFITWSKQSKTGDRRKWVTLRHYYSLTLISYYSFGKFWYSWNQSTLHIKSNLRFVYWVLLCLFFKDMHYNTMIRTFCILEKKWRSVLFITYFVDPLWGIRYTY